MSAEQTADELRDALDSTESVEIPTGPMADGPTRQTELPDVLDVRSYEQSITGLGVVTVVDVELNLATETYRFLNDPDNPNQESPGEAIYAVMDDVGINRPDGTPDLGVQLGDDIGEDRVRVQGYIPQGGGLMTDGGLLTVAPDVLLAFGAVSPMLVGAALLNDLGEEYLVKNSVATSFDVGVYNDGTDAIGDAEDLADITTEPSDGNYVRQTQTFSAADLSGDWGTDTDNDAVFDMTNTTGTVDSWFMEINFTAVDTGDGSGTDHLVCTGALSQSYDLSNLTQLTISAGGVGFTVS